MLIPLMRRYRRVNGHWPHVFRPRSFNEKVTWRMLFDRRGIYAKLNGKFECRAFVAERLGRDDLLVPLVGLVSDPDQFLAMPLPDRYILKINDGSMLRLCLQGDEPATREFARATAREWLAGSYAKYHHEWAYTQVRHCVIVEEFLGTAEMVYPHSLKINCFDGRARFIHYNEYSIDDSFNANLDRDWNRYPYTAPGGPALEECPRPPCLDEALAIAETIAAGLDFLRVDFHIVGERLDLGELTTLHTSGLGDYGTRERDLEFGSYWRLPRGVGPISALFGGQPDVQ